MAIAVSCVKISDPVTNDPVKSFVTPNTVFIINEGNFGWGNGSLSYFSYDSAKIYNDIFRTINKRTMGDVPYSMLVYGNNAYIVINNSEKIEVIDRRTLESKTTITGFISPRNIIIAVDDKAYVSSMYSDSVTIVDLKKNKISGYVNIHKTSEAMVKKDGTVFVSNWIGGNEVFIINTETDKLTDSIEVGIEPESMALDKNGILWVLCNGGWTRENYAELVGINQNTHEKVKRFIFPSKLNSPLNLMADGNGDTLYYIDDGIRRMDITADELPSGPFIDKSDHLIYKIGINPVNGDIFLTDAVDYQQNGYVIIYNNKGILRSRYQTGIIPGAICFMVESSSVTE
jgi:YVTN family beta-propeller protein